MTALATLIVDSFGGASLDTTRWPTGSRRTNTGGSISITSGELVLNHNWDGSAATFPPPDTFVGSAAGEIANSSVFWRFKPLVSNADDGAVFTLSGVMNIANDEGFGFRHQSDAVSGNGSLICTVFNDLGDEWWVDVATIASYAPNGAHAWLRVRHSGTSFFWDTAPDAGGTPGTWTQRATYSQTGSGIAFDNMTGFLGTGGASIFFQTYHWADDYQASFVVSPPKFDGVNSNVATNVATSSTASPATYSYTGVATKDIVSRVSLASPATYSLVGFNLTASAPLHAVSVASPTTYETVPNFSSVRNSYGSVASPMAFSFTAQAAVSMAGVNTKTIASPAAYAITPVSSSDHTVITSVAAPASYLLSGQQSVDLTNGQEEVPVLITPVSVPPLTQEQYLAWLTDPTALRVVLLETQCIDENGNTEFVFLASRGFVTKLEDGDGAQHYLPLMKGGLDYQQTISLGLLSDGNEDIKESYGDIEIDNTEGDLDNLFDRVWLYQPARAYLGDVRWPRRDFRQIFDGTVEDIDSSNRDVMNIRLHDKLYRLTMPLHEMKIGGSVDNPDQLLPAVFGECHNITPLLQDANTLTYVYHTRKAENAFEVRDNGIPIKRVIHDTEPASFSLLAQPAGRITASVQGDVTDGIYYNTVPDLILNLVKNWGTESLKRFTDEDIDLDNFELFRLNNPQPVGLFVSSRMTVLDACQQIAASIGARLTITLDGRLRLIRIEVPPIGTPIDVGESDMVAGSLRIINRLVLSPSAKLQYCKNWTVQADTASGLPEEHKAMFAREWFSTTAVNPDTRDKFNLWGEPDPEDSLLLTQADASNECLRRVFLRSKTKHVMEFVGYPDLIFTEVGSSMRLTHRRFGLEKSKTGQVVSVAVNWTTHQPTIQVMI